MNNAPGNAPENLKELQDRARQPGPFREALVAQKASLDLNGLVALAARHGVVVSADALESFAKSQNVSSELSDEALAGVTGGGLSWVDWLVGNLLGMPSGTTSV